MRPYLVQHQQNIFSIQTTFLALFLYTALGIHRLKQPTECRNQMPVQTLLKRPSGLLRIPGNIYTIYQPNRVSGSTPRVRSALLSYAVLQTQSCLPVSSTTNIRSIAIMHSPHQVHSAMKMRRLDTQKTRRLHTWSEDYPEVRHIEVKSKGKNADWEDVKAIVTLHRDKRGRARRVWTRFSENNPRKKELAVEWPEDKQAIIIRKLRDACQASHDEFIWDDIWDDESQVDKDVYKVTEKRGPDGRRFWREVISKGESTAEEEYVSWDEWMREEGHYDELDRQMGKSW